MPSDRVESLRAQLAAKHARELDEFERGQAAIAAFVPICEPGGYTLPRPHAFRDETWISFAWGRYESIRSGAQPDPVLLRALLAAFPPLPAMLWRGGGTMSYGRADRRPSQHDLSKSREIAPVAVILDPNSYAHSASFEWFAAGETADLRIKVESPLHRIRRVSFSGRVNPVTDAPFHNISQNWSVDLPGASIIRWAAGSDRSFGQAILCFDPPGPADIVSTLLGEGA